MWQIEHLVEGGCDGWSTLQKGDVADRVTCGRKMWWIEQLAERGCGGLEQLAEGSRWRMGSRALVGIESGSIVL